ncbi:hypothetical protein [Candidatus Colwellia aromaticivorans]|uniref:hypothetical protein n=1 Tax=Candidatus Colwellia aromaticivorans TaxID=2267621 RepID=UPI000DF28539|nr:hypothetical protein [Candidatus Colwellia aromaticivorans]
MMKNTALAFIFVYIALVSTLSNAHHVLGRPSYSLNEDSNTPPSMAIETQIGEYFITYMVFPAFPKPNEPGRVNLYATRIDNGEVLAQPITFSVRDDSFFTETLGFGQAESSEQIGVQTIDDGVYRQGFLFRKKGNYIVRAYFEDGGEPYEIDFPLQVGESSPIGPIGATIGFIFFLLLSINIAQRKRIARSKVQQGQSVR